MLLPQEIATGVCAGLSLPALERILARSQPQALPTVTLEDWLCAIFEVQGQAIAPVTLLADGLQPGTAYWLRADPAHVQMQREQLILQPDIKVNEDEATKLCAALNAHFAAEGLHFIAPHPQRWYLRLDAAADMVTYPPSQVAGRNLRAFMPQGMDALRWHKMFNEVQMLFFEHPVNQARVARGELPINSVWLWGGGRTMEKLAQPFSSMVGDSVLAEAFAKVSGIHYTTLPHDAGRYAEGEGALLIVWGGLQRTLQQGDLHAWRESLQRFEQVCAKPLWQALRSGRISSLTLDTMHADQAQRFVLTRNATWKFWRSPKALTHQSLV